MRELLIATSNAGKIPAIRASLEGVPVTLVSLVDVEAGEEPEETESSFEGNAVLKAQAYGSRTGLLTLADDSGLEVDALDGRPGVRSARYVPGSDIDRYTKILSEMQNVPDDQRKARYIDVIAIYDPTTGTTRTCSGLCEGRIAREPRGAEGFGYDPIFVADELGKTFAESSEEEKLLISHRGRAMQKAREILLNECV